MLNVFYVEFKRHSVRFSKIKFDFRYNLLPHLITRVISMALTCFRLNEEISNAVPFTLELRFHKTLSIFVYFKSSFIIL